MERVRLVYVYERRDPRLHSLYVRGDDISHHLNMSGVSTRFEQKDNTLAFLIEGSYEAIECGIEVLNKQFFPPKKLEIDKGSFAFNWLEYVWEGFKTSTKRGHRTALAYFKKQGFREKPWYNRQGHFSYSSLELPS